VGSGGVRWGPAGCLGGRGGGEALRQVCVWQKGAIRLLMMNGFRSRVLSKYLVLATLEDKAKRYVRLKDPFYHPHDKGTLDPRNGGFEFPIEDEIKEQDVILKEDPEDSGE